MLETKTFTRIKCDGECGRYLGNGDYDYAVFDGDTDALLTAMDSGWVETPDGKHYCEFDAPPQCEECEEFGHWAEDCPKLHAEITSAVHDTSSHG